MKRVFAFFLALTLFFTFGCSSLNLSAAATPTATPTAAPTATPTPNPTPEPTPSPTPAPPEGLSSQPFDFLDNTYALWRIIRHKPVDGTVQYDFQLLAMTDSIHCRVGISNNEAKSITPSYEFILIKPDGDSKYSSNSDMAKTYDIPFFKSTVGTASGFAASMYILTYSFKLSEQEDLPTTAELSYKSDDPTVTIEFTNPIVIDAES